MRFLFILPILITYFQPVYAGEQGISLQALKSCSDSGIHECQFRFAEHLEANSDPNGAKKLYEMAYEGGYEPAGVALLRLIKHSTEPKDNSASLSVTPAAEPTGTTQVSANSSPATTSPADRLPMKYSDCWEATLTSSQAGEVLERRTAGGPSKSYDIYLPTGMFGWVSEPTTSEIATQYKFCFKGPNRAEGALITDAEPLRMRKHANVLFGSWSTKGSSNYSAVQISLHRETGNTSVIVILRKDKKTTGTIMSGKAVELAPR
jgi:hypothetical protein